MCLLDNDDYGVGGDYDDDDNNNNLIYASL
jgi:hypothetical protein